MLRHFIVFILLILPTGPIRALSHQCASALQELFSEKIDAKKAGEFLHLQGQITLHRLAWTYLRAQKEDTDQKIQRTEKTILDLLDRKYTDSNPDFIKARKAFEEQPLSRTTLAEIAPFLKEAMSANMDERDRPFRLNASDLKLLSAIARFERSTATNGQYDHLMLDSKSSRGMLNFIKLINSSYKLDTTTEESALQIEAKLAGLESIMQKMEEKFASFLNELKLPLACQEEESCSLDTSMNSFFKLNEEAQYIFWEALAPSLESDDVLLERMTYGELWLQVRHKKKQNPSESSSSKPSSSRKMKPYSAELPLADPDLNPVNPTVISDLGLLIKDPVSIIVKDGPNRRPMSWEKFDKAYLEAMAQAILSNDKVFEYDGKLFDRKTGKSISIESAMNKIPPQRREEFKKLLVSDGPGFLNSQVRAMVNGDKAFAAKNGIYNLSGDKLDPATEVAQGMSRKLSLTVTPDRYMGMGEKYLQARALALINDRPYFKHDEKVMDSYTGRHISSPFRSIAGHRDVKLEKERRRLYEGLSDEDLIRNYHRDFPNSKCGHYAIIDKTEAVIRVYANNGTKVFETETLLGTEGKDARTRWITYEPRQSSLTTGAGTYTIREQDLNDSYNKRNFNNNIISFVGHNMVFAIHQVPVGKNERYTKFGTGNPEDRRGTGGCANVALEDFKKLRKWLRPQCKVYVLPEEPQNRFVVKDNALHFISTKPVDKNISRLYNYTAHDIAAARPIKIIINTEQTRFKSENNVFSRAFIEALEKEKPKLMELYGLTNDEYNDLAMLAFGIMGNESDFGRSLKLWGKETQQPLVVLAKIGDDLLEGDVDKETLRTSRGYTQIKYLPEGKFKKAYPEITKKTLILPQNAAIATVAYLAEAMHTLSRITRNTSVNESTVRVSREQMIDYLPYIYMGSAWRLKSKDPEKRADPDTNIYIQNVRRNMALIEIKEKFE